MEIGNSDYQMLFDSLKESFRKETGPAMFKLHITTVRKAICSKVLPEKAEDVHSFPTEEVQICYQFSSCSVYFGEAMDEYWDLYLTY